MKSKLVESSVSILTYVGFLAFVWWDSGAGNAACWLAFFVIAAWWLGRPQNFRPY